MIQLKSFTLVLIKINYGQIGDQTRLFYTTNPVFYTSGNRFCLSYRHVWESLIFSLVLSDNRNTRSTCPTQVFTGFGQTLMSRLAWSTKILGQFVTRMHQFIGMLWWSSRTLTKIKSQSQKRFNERKYKYLKYKNKNHSGMNT
jgi:hypothetical protein